MVTVGWSGQLDFLVDAEGQEQFYNVAFDLQPVQKEVVWDGVITKDSMWAYAREGSAKQQMRACYEHLVDEELSGIEAITNENRAKNLYERFSQEKMYKQFVDTFYQEEKFDIEEWLTELGDIETQ